MTRDGDLVPGGVVVRRRSRTAGPGHPRRSGHATTREWCAPGPGSGGFFARSAAFLCGAGSGASTAGGQVVGDGAPREFGPLEVVSPACRPSLLLDRALLPRFPQSLPLKDTLAPSSTRPRPQSTVADRNSQPTAARKMALSTTKKTCARRSPSPLDPPLCLPAIARPARPPCWTPLGVAPAAAQLRVAGWRGVSR